MADTASRYSDYRAKIEAEQALFRRIRRSMPEWWATLANTLGITSAIFAGLALASAVAIAIPATVLLALTAGFALFAAVISHHRWKATVGYAYCLKGIHLALHILRDELALTKEWTDEHVKSCLAEVLTAFAAAFQWPTAAPCRTCIKVIDVIPPEGQTRKDISPERAIDYAYARTFCRDSVTGREIGHTDATKNEAPVKTNTAFSFLFENINERCYVCNDIPLEMGKQSYQNTSIRKYGGKLPYRATMVWPIRLLTTTPSSETGHHFTGQQDIMGYLTVDTVKTNVFRREIDFDLGAAVADALYIFFDKVRPLENP